jgi:Ca-activated chloride channel family protein
MTLLTLVLLAGAGAGGWYGYRKLNKKSDTASGCTATSTLSVVAAPEIAPAVKAVADQWNSQGTQVDGACTRVTVTAAAPSDIAAAIASAQNVAVTGLGKPNGGITLPDVWIPDSSTWLLRLQNASNLLAMTGTSVASSPIVIAMPQPIAAALANGKAPTWSDLLAKLTSGTIHPGIVDPNVDASGLNTLLAVGAVVRGSTSSGSAIAGLKALTPTDAQAAIVAAIRALASGESRLRDDLMNRFPRAADPATLARSLAVAPIPEQSLLAYNAAQPPVPLAGLYLTPAPQALDYPFTPISNLAKDKADAAQQFGSLLTGDSWTDALAGRDLRNASGTYGKAMPTVTGMPPGPFPATPTIPRAALDQALSTWSAVTVPGRMLAVIDVSGSMAAKVPSAGNATREEVTISAAGRGLSLFDDQWLVGLWTFSTKLNGANDYRELVPIASLAENRTKMAGALAKIVPVPNGSTGLYDTVLAAYKRVQQDWDPSRVNSVVIMTDGQNDDPSGITLPQLIAQLHQIADPARPVEVIAIGIGTDVSLTELNKIATATGGGAFVTSDPSNIADIFLKAISLRPGTAK